MDLAQVCTGGTCPGLKPHCLRRPVKAQPVGRPGPRPVFRADCWQRRSQPRLASPAQRPPTCALRATALTGSRQPRNVCSLKHAPCLPWARLCAQSPKTLACFSEGSSLPPVGRISKGQPQSQDLCHKFTEQAGGPPSLRPPVSSRGSGGSKRPSERTLLRVSGCPRSHVLP